MYIVSMFRTSACIYVAFSIISLSGIVFADSAADETYTDDSTFQDDIVSFTNTIRDQHNATALKWNTTLADYAATVVESCVFKHSGGPYGENLVSGYANATQAIEAWANESTQYNYNKGAFAENTGHFTQLVWKNTTQVGCGRKNCTGSDVDNVAPGWFVACSYYPPGNYLGEFQANVQAPVGAGLALKPTVLHAFMWSAAVVAVGFVL